MQYVLSLQSDRDLRIDACIEIGRHSALAGPFKQICQKLSPETKPEYYPTILRNENSLEKMLPLACNLFCYGWKMDLAALNFPYDNAACQVLLDLPPYAWNHTTQYWHEGRLAQNYRNRKQPPNDLLGTLMDDSSDIDLRWSMFDSRSCRG